MKSIRQVKNLNGKVVLLRVGYDVPLKGNRVLDDFRIRTTLPTLNLLREKGARIVIVSHIGRDPKNSLKPAALRLKKYMPVKFIPEIFGTAATKAIGSMKNGEVIMLENLRSDPGEKSNDPVFAKKLAALGDIYVNEAFLVSHRSDASIVRVPRLMPRYAGLQFEKEVQQLSLVLHPKHPFLAILGGAKFETKMPLIKKYLKMADTVFVGGALVNNFYKELGYEVGTSLLDPDAPRLAALLKNKKLTIPSDVVVEINGKEKNVLPEHVGKTQAIIDVGPQSIKSLLPYIKKAKLILWNGPLGKGTHAKATIALLKLLAKARATTIIGGGDTVEVISKLKMERSFDFVSTGGGAALDFLAEGTIPGIQALK